MNNELGLVLTEKLKSIVLGESIEDLGNKILYDMCQKYFDHKEENAIFAKTLILGRAYAVALERDNSKTKSKNDKIINDAFYRDVIIPTFLNKNSKIDEKIGSLKGKKLNDNNLKEIFNTYLFLLEMTKRLKRGTKRSFCSKYLHFHLPELFFIYDSRAKNTITKYEITVSKKHKDLIKEFPRGIYEYINFFCKCLKLQHWVNEKWGQLLTPRQIDKLLLMI